MGYTPMKEIKSAFIHNATKPGDPTPGIKKSPDIITGALLICF